MYIFAMDKNSKYLSIISKIEKIRSKNNVNWMNVLRLAFKLDANQAKKIMQKINYDDKKISQLLNKLSK
tara:strand:+ start:1505 stop:1711 length:207 start_codon:yes stop_codon:yes gene_type:complete